MSLAYELSKNVSHIFRQNWSSRNGQKVPESEDLGLGNEAVKIVGTVLYADLDGSTNLVDNQSPSFAAEIYKAYLHCAAKIIRAEGGVITAYDGDRIMAVYIGDFKNTRAARTALKINHVVKKIINPAIRAQHSVDYEVKQVVGVDTSDLFVTRTGVRGANDLVWVGRAANYAAKLTALSSDYASRITGEVYDKMNDIAKLSGGRNMWEEVNWSQKHIMRIYRSTWMWKP